MRDADGAVALVQREDGKVLVVWNRKLRGWTMPGGHVEEGETPVQAVVRELLEETGGRSVPSDIPRLIYSAPGVSSAARTVYVFEVSPVYVGTPREMEEGCPVTWMQPDELVRCSPFPLWYSKMFHSIADPEVRRG